MIYVAGPISADPIGGARKAISIASELLRMGFTPFVPHLAILWELMFPLEYEEWMAYDLAWLRKCDVLFRVEGKSPGADREVALAKSLGKPVFFSTDEARTWFEAKRA